MNAIAAMPFREKEAWLALAGMLVGYGGYFTAAAATAGEPLGTPPKFILWFSIATVVRVTIEFGGRALLASGARREARAPADERDRAIATRSVAAAYGMLLVTTILFGVVLPLGPAHGWDVANPVLLGIVMAEIVRACVAIASYRRGWHG